MDKLTLIIPAKRESESLPQFLNELKEYDYNKIVILEDTDFKTIDSIKDFKEIKIIYQKIKGYGAAIKEGIFNTNTKYFCIINADGSMDPCYLNSMVNELENKKLDFIFTSRYELNGGSDDDSFLTKIGNYFFTSLGKIFFRLNISDILFTYVLGKTKNFNSLILKSNDFTLCVEFPIKSHRSGYKLGSMPSFERKRIGGKKKVNEFRDGFLILIKMIKMFIKYE